MMIRLTVPSIEEDDLDAVRAALQSGALVQGARVAEFEKLVADLVGVEHAVAVSNCTCALHLALLALDVRPGDTCVVTAYSWIATANVIELCGARPLFVDVDERTGNIDPQKLEDVLCRIMSNGQNAKRVKAVLPVHAFGQTAEMDAVASLCERWNLPIVEDAACALGATYNGRQAGTWGTMGCFSFHPRKAITTGEGGMIIARDDALALRLRALRNHGQREDVRPADFTMPGYNYRLTELQAALGSSQMKKLDRVIAARRRAAARYDQLLEGTPLKTPHITAGAGHVFQSYVSLLPPSVAERRAEIISAAMQSGVETQVGTIHMPLTSYYRNRYGHKPGDFPGTDSIASRALTLPLFEAITADQQRTVVDVVLGLLG